MKITSKTNDRSTGFSVRMTPLIDVVFLLMIFFIMTLKFQEEEGVLKNRLPLKGDQNIVELKKDWETVFIKLATENGKLMIYMQERVVDSYTSLLGKLNLLPQQIMIVIEPEKKVPYKYVIGVYNTCLKAKKSNIVFSASPR